MISKIINRRSVKLTDLYHIHYFSKTIQILEYFLIFNCYTIANLLPDIDIYDYGFMEWFIALDHIVVEINRRILQAVPFFNFTKLLHLLSITFYRLQNRKYRNWTILRFHGNHHFDSRNPFSERLLIQIFGSKSRLVHSLD